MAKWWEFVFSTECTDEEADALRDVLANAAFHWAAAHGVDIHHDVACRRPSWLEHAIDCGVPDCPFPAEWVIEVAANGSVTEHPTCGPHRHEVAVSAVLSSEVAWGNAEVNARQI